MIARRAALAFPLAFLPQGQVMAQSPLASVTGLAPTGTLRAAINFGNPVLAQRGPGGEPGGVSVALAHELARHLGVPLAIVPFDGAGKVTDALASNVYDIVFLARDPVRGQGIAFTDPYVLIEGGYVVRTAAPYQTVESVDAPGVRVGVARAAPTTSTSPAPSSTPPSSARRPAPKPPPSSSPARTTSWPASSSPWPSSSTPTPASASSPAASCPSSRPWAPPRPAPPKPWPPCNPSSPR